MFEWVMAIMVSEVTPRGEIKPATQQIFGFSGILSLLKDFANLERKEIACVIFRAQSNEDVCTLVRRKNKLSVIVDGKEETISEEKSILDELKAFAENENDQEIVLGTDSQEKTYTLLKERGQLHIIIK